jgi:hypothetical protein
MARQGISSWLGFHPIQMHLKKAISALLELNRGVVGIALLLRVTVVIKITNQFIPKTWHVASVSFYLSVFTLVEQVLCFSQRMVVRDPSAFAYWATSCKDNKTFCPH